MTASLVGLCISIALWPFAAWWRAYVLIVMWGWFVTPNFNLSAPSIYVVVAILLMVSLATPNRESLDSEVPDCGRVIARCLAVGFLWPASILGLGWAWRWLQWGLA